MTIYEAKILPAICIVTSSIARNTEIARVIAIASVTAGLNNPPEIRKKTHTLTISEKPNDSAIYISTCGLKPFAAFVVD